MRIVNLNLTYDPAGVGWTLCSLINKYTDHEAIHMVGEIHYYNYPTNIHLPTSPLPPADVAGILDDSDVIHINQHPPFGNHMGLNFYNLIKRNWKKVIFEFHGDPSLDLTNHQYVQGYYYEKCPVILVHPHYKKWLPKAIVPEITTPVNETEWLPNWREKRPPYKLGKSSSSKESKNRPEFEELCKMEGIDAYEIHAVSHRECLGIKRDIIDIGHDSYDLGYVNISAFENACFGVPTFSSGKSEMELYGYRDSSGGLPFVDVANNEQASSILKSWIKDPDQLNERSREIRTWIEKYWNGRDCAQIWTEIYEENLK